ncbi:MAG: YecA family protein [Thermomicrobiales bacterium]
MATETVDVTTLEFTPEMATACRRAGRNMPCPNGSGRKVKFCPCPVLHPQEAATVPWEIEKTVSEDMAVFLLAPRFNDVLPGAWERFTDGDTWPGSMQALFTSKDQLTVSRFVDWFLRAYPMERYHGRTPATLFAQDRADRIGPAGRRAAAAYAESLPALLEVTEYTAGERLVARDLLTGQTHDVFLSPELEFKDEFGPGWAIWTFVYTLDGMARVSAAGIAVPPPGAAELIAAVRDTVGVNPETAALRDAFPALIRRDAEIEKHLEEAEKPQWVHAVYTVEDSDDAVALLTADNDFTAYEGKEVLPRAASPFSWPLPEGESGERFVAVGSGRVVLAASSRDLLAASRPALEAKLGQRIAFVTKTDEPTVLLLRRSWQPKGNDHPANSEATVADIASETA